MDPVKLYTAQQTRDLDKYAIAKQFAGNGFILMSRAGEAAYNKIIDLWPETKRFLIFCGQGNNGGDGFIIASLAAQKGYLVKLVFLGAKEKLTADSLKAYQNYELLLAQKNSSLVSLQDAINFESDQQSYKNTVVVDALLGTGLNKAPSGDYQVAIDYINQLKNNNCIKIFAVDIPSGLSADTGVAYYPAVKADATITFIGRKQGLYTQDGPDYTGSLYFDSLGVDNNTYQEIDYNSQLLSEEWSRYVIRNELKPRQKNSYKHQFGHVVIIGGGQGMFGAVLMAGRAALRTGAGLVTIVTHSSNTTEITNNQPELMTCGINEADISVDNSQLNSLLEKASVYIIGPGLGQTSWAEKIFNYWLSYREKNQANKPAVIDADGLNLLSASQLSHLSHSFMSDNTVLTPHVGEAGRLLNKKLDIAHDRFTATREIAQIYHSICVLKGVGSLVCSNDEQAIGQVNKFALCPTGNPGMATAGMGDILSGIIAGLIAQGLSTYTAACLGVYIHGLAGDKQAKEFGERGLIATDLLLEIRKIINHDK